MGYFFRFIATIIGIAFAFAGIMLLIALIATIFAIPLQLFVPFDLWVFSFPHTVDVFFSTNWMAFLASAGLFLVVGVPITLLIFAGLKMIFDFESGSKTFGIALFLLWMIGLAILSFVVITALLT